MMHTTPPVCKPPLHRSPLHREGATGQGGARLRTATITSHVSEPARRCSSTLPPAASATLRCKSRSSRARRWARSPARTRNHLRITAPSAARPRWRSPSPPASRRHASLTPRPARRGSGGARRGRTPYNRGRNARPKLLPRAPRRYPRSPALDGAALSGAHQLVDAACAVERGHQHHPANDDQRRRHHR